MGRGHSFFEQLSEYADISMEPLSTQPIIEIAGENRVLIENHFGVKEYSRQKITAAVKFGCVHICGTGLNILRMTKEQLIIQGRIMAISLERR